VIQRLTKNAGLKLLAVVLAFGLWVLVAGEQESVRVFTVPLDYQIPRDRVLAGQPTASAQVRVKGSESILRGIAAEDLGIPVDLFSALPGEKTALSLGPKSVRGIPAGAAVDTVTPDRLVVTIEEIVSRIVPVSPRLEGSPAPGWRLVDVQVSPPQITIEGSRSDVERMPVVYTEPIPLHGRQEGLTVMTGISIGNPKVHARDARPVTVTLRIEKDETAK